MSEYIEREAALDHIRDYIEEYSWHTDEHGFHSPEWCAMKEAEMVLTDLPAADVRPVGQGRWEWDVLDGTPGYRPVVLCCSNCHRVSFSGWDYCPNCGADMREGEADGT